MITVSYETLKKLSEDYCTLRSDVYVCFTFQTHKCIEYKMIRPVIMEALNEKKDQAVAAS